MKQLILFTLLLTLAACEKDYPASAVCDWQVDVEMYFFGADRGTLKANRYVCRQNDMTACDYAVSVDDPNIFDTDCVGAVLVNR